MLCEVLNLLKYYGTIEVIKEITRQIDESVSAGGVIDNNIFVIPESEVKSNKLRKTSRTAVDKNRDVNMRMYICTYRRMVSIPITRIARDTQINRTESNP